MPQGKSFCIICSQGAEDRDTCPDCEGAHYCSLECRQTDASIHKILCASTQNFRARPATPSIRAIFFPSIESKPRFIWIKLNPKLKPEHRPIQHLTKLLGNHPEEVPIIKIQRIDFNNMRNEDVFEDRIIMFMKEDDEGETNKNMAIETVVEECKKLVLPNIIPPPYTYYYPLLFLQLSRSTFG